MLQAGRGPGPAAATCRESPPRKSRPCPPPTTPLPMTVARRRRMIKDHDVPTRNQPGQRLLGAQRSQLPPAVHLARRPAAASPRSAASEVHPARQRAASTSAWAADEHGLRGPGLHVGPGRGLDALADISETDDAYLVEVELPGVNKDQVNADVNDRELVITGAIAEPRRRRRAGDPAAGPAAPGASSSAPLCPATSTRRRSAPVSPTGSSP